MPEESPQTEDKRKTELEYMMPEIVKRLGRKHAHMQFVFEDYYKTECPDGYGYTQFCKYVGEYRGQHDVAYHNIYIPGEQMQIDFAGDPLYIKDYYTKEPQKLTVLVCVMPYSNMPFMIALPMATTEWFFHGLNKALEFMGDRERTQQYGIPSTGLRQVYRHTGVGEDLRPVKTGNGLRHAEGAECKGHLYVLAQYAQE